MMLKSVSKVGVAVGCLVLLVFLLHSPTPTVEQLAELEGKVVVICGASSGNKPLLLQPF